MKYIRIYEIAGTGQNSKLVEQSSIDRNKIKKIKLDGGRCATTYDDKYILVAPGPMLPMRPTDAPTKANWEFSKTAYINKYKGLQLEISGRLRGAQRARKLVKKLGSLNQQSYSSKLIFFKRDILTKWGTLGLKVYINK